tara:strand:+ start:360 stop:629 length:270 start_codon:yes stop_codon:yes gene_type:complete
MDIDNKAFDKLEKSINDLIQHNFFRMHENIFKLAVFNMVRGIAYGFGWVMGATILVYILTLFLSQIEFIPILGEFASRLIEQIEKFENN